jgi:hypothetical protein
VRAPFIGVLIPTHRGFNILTNLSLNRFRIAADKEESKKGITQFKRIGLEGMNSYSGWVWVLSGRILAIGLVERDHTRRPDRSAVPTGLVEWVACREEEGAGGLGLGQDSDPWPKENRK